MKSQRDSRGVPTLSLLQNPSPLHVRRRRHHGSEARAKGGGGSVAGCGSTVVASCDRLRRFLRTGLGRVLVKWFAHRASRFGYHGTRNERVGFRRRNKVPTRSAKSHPPASGFEHATAGARDSIRKWHIERGLCRMKISAARNSGHPKSYLNQSSSTWRNSGIGARR